VNEEKMKSTTRLLLVVLALSLLLSACAVVARNALIGKWSEGQSGFVMEFTNDGHLRLTSQGMTIEVTYQFLSDSEIQLQGAQALGLSEATTNVPFKIEGETLTLTIQEQPTVLTRLNK
jgi:hypothetical protein